MKKYFLASTMFLSLVTGAYAESPTKYSCYLLSEYPAQEKAYQTRISLQEVEHGRVKFIIRHLDYDTDKVYQRDKQYKNYTAKIKEDYPAEIKNEGEVGEISWSGILRNDFDYSMKGWLNLRESDTSTYTEFSFKGNKIQSFAVSKCTQDDPLSVYTR